MCRSVCLQIIFLLHTHTHACVSILRGLCCRVWRMRCGPREVMGRRVAARRNCTRAPSPARLRCYHCEARSRERTRFCAPTSGCRCCAALPAAPLPRPAPLPLALTRSREWPVTHSSEKSPPYASPPPCMPLVDFPQHVHSLLADGPSSSPAGHGGMPLRALSDELIEDFLAFLAGLGARLPVAGFQRSVPAFTASGFTTRRQPSTGEES